MMTTEAAKGPGPVWSRLLAPVAAATVLAGAAEVGGGARAQWTVTNLHPAGATSSHALGVSGGQQVGDVTIDSALHASLWRGTAASWVDLHPPGAASSQARAVDGGQQVGSASIGGPSHAGVWSGTAANGGGVRSRRMRRSRRRKRPAGVAPSLCGATRSRCLRRQPWWSKQDR